MPVEIGHPIPEFSLYDHERNQVSSEDLHGKKALVVFIPFPFTRVCHGELCSIRDDLERLQSDDTKVIVVTCDTVPSNARWAADEGFNFPILSDYWPHGAVSDAFGCFDSRIGAAKRYSYVVDREGIVREIIKSDDLGTAREHDRYAEALSTL